MPNNTPLPVVCTLRDAYFAGESFSGAKVLEFDDIYKAWRASVRPGGMSEGELQRSFWRGFMRAMPMALRGNTVPMPKGS